MAALSYFVVGPSAIACLIALLRGRDKHKYTPSADFHTATVDIVIPAFNEESNIIFCLESILKQTMQPTHIYLVDDGSTDNTSLYAEKFSNFVHLKNIKIIHKKTSAGKTPGISEIAHESTADILFVLDADTILYSPNYISRVVEELYTGSHIASACGIVMPETEKDRKELLKENEIKEFSAEFPKVAAMRKHRWQSAISNRYREEMYLFLERFIYHGQMVFCGSLINPVGCAVAYRRKYLLDILDHYENLLGSDLTTSEDVFIGFSFVNLGYRNVQVSDVGAVTVEPYLSKLPSQIFKWSSSYFQCCYYFNDLVMTPFKYPIYLMNRSKTRKYEKEMEEHKNDKNYKTMHNIPVENKEVVDQTYYQPLGINITKKYGRPIGWFVFTGLLEKIAFPIVFLLLIVFRLWDVLALTIIAEVLLFSIVVATMYKKNRASNFITSILIAPIRYAFLLFELVVMGNFIKDLWITKNRKWRK